ncbi:MAG: hypothetical protein J6P80_00780 [Kiritimatiellae bacterium]|nr:hypothetical protein [Kiritimatiellia bacterium]MBR4615171.1 hypothetical protein [Kiritimatiellia bacterium]
MNKGLILEYDFAAIDGASLLFDTAKAFFAKIDNLPFDRGLEARFLAGQNYLLGLTDFFKFVNTKKTPQKAAKDLPAAFQKELAAKIVAEGLSPQVEKLVKLLADNGIKVAITTRAPLDQVRGVFEKVLGENVVLHYENSVTYGNVKWDAWVRAANAIGTEPRQTMVVTGSGFGVKSAIHARFAAVGIQREHTAWQDFSGANLVADGIDAAFMRKLSALLKIGA